MIDRRELHEKDEVTPESHEKFIHDLAQTRAQLNQPGNELGGPTAGTASSAAFDTGSVSSAMQSTKAPPSEGSKLAVANLRKGHSAWEKARRDWDNIYSRSTTHPNTLGYLHHLLQT